MGGDGVEVVEMLSQRSIKAHFLWAGAASRLGEPIAPEGWAIVDPAEPVPLQDRAWWYVEGEMPWCRGAPRIAECWGWIVCGDDVEHIKAGGYVVIRREADAEGQT